MNSALITELDVELRIPGDVFRAVNPTTFDFPELVAERHLTDFGTIITVTAAVAGAEETFDLLNTVNADYEEVAEAVRQFNADTVAGWQKLLSEFFAEQRLANAERRALLDRDEAFLLDMEAGFLR